MEYGLDGVEQAAGVVGMVFGRDCTPATQNPSVLRKFRVLRGVKRGLVHGRLTDMFLLKR